MSDQVHQLENDIEALRLQEAENNRQLDVMTERRRSIEGELADLQELITNRRRQAQNLNKDITDKLEQLYELKNIPEVTDADLVFGP